MTTEVIIKAEIVTTEPISKDQLKTILIDTSQISNLITYTIKEIEIVKEID